MISTDKYGRFFGLLLILAILACPAAFAADVDIDDEEDYLDEVGQIVADPIEPWNRAMFKFNDALLENVARPAYKGYAYVTPQFMRTGIKNFFHNLAFPGRFINNLLQGRGKAAGVEMSRFILNTTAGLGGLIDVAKSHKPVVEVEDEDFGQTLGVWGVGEGFYIVWPFLGPSTARDSVGMAGDYFLDPVTYIEPWGAGFAVQAGRTFNQLDDILDTYDTMKRAAVEPYSSMKNAYVQYRQARIAK